MPKRSNTRRVFPQHLRPVSMDPDDFRPTHDLVEHLTRHPENYAGERPLTLKALPSFLRTNLDRIRAHVDSSPSLATTTCCAISSGLYQLSEADEVSALIELKRRLDHAPADSDPDDIEDAANWFRFFPLAVPSYSFSSPRRQDITITPAVRDRLGNLAGSLGLTLSSLASFSVLIALSDQPECLSSHRRDMDRIMRLFLKRVDRRRRVAETLLETIG